MEINLEKYKHEFINKVGSYDNWCIPDAFGDYGYPPNSIFFTEALVLYTMAREHNITHFIESGVYRGGSTSLWCRVFPDIQLHSIDYVREGNDPRKKWNAVSSTLSSMYSNIEFIEGDGNVKVIELIQKYPNEKIGVFIDGPKDEVGLRLAEQCIKFDNVCFSSLHDFTHAVYFSTRKDTQCNNLVAELDKNHIQLKNYPKGPGLTVLHK
jgi:hypothetical protein